MRDQGNWGKTRVRESQSEKEGNRTKGEGGGNEAGVMPA